MTNSEAIALLKEGRYLERYPTEKVFHVCADGNVFLQANTSDARAHTDGKGIELVTLSVGTVLAAEETKAEKLAKEEAEKAEAEKLAKEAEGKSEAGEIEVTEEVIEDPTAIIETSAEGIAEVTELETEVTEVKEEVKPSKKAK